MSIEERLLSNGDSDFINLANILGPNCCPENVALTFREKEIRNLARGLQLNEGVSIRGSLGYLNKKIFPEIWSY
jgi:hypothetical protein